MKKSVSILFLLFMSVSAQALNEKKILDIWGTCYLAFNCTGSAIGIGKTGAECRAQNGHSLLMPSGACFNF